MNDETLRLIEDCLPLDVIGDRASREKAARVGNLSSLHIWWGRKPSVASRAAVYAALVPAPLDHTQRTAYLRHLIALCDNPIPGGTLAQARRQIKEVYREHAKTSDQAATPLVVDTFAGSGSIPLEALRLGCRTFASDLNPVAYLIEQCVLVYPQQHPELGQLVAHWGRRWLEQVKQAVQTLYPPLVLGDTTASLPLDEAGSAAAENAHIPDVYLWSRTVTCPNPQCVATVPVTQNTLLAERKTVIRALRIVPDLAQRNVAFVAAQATSRDGLGFNPDDLSSRGNARCFCCGSTIDKAYMKREGKAGRFGTQLMAVSGRHPTTRVRHYLAASDVPPHYIPNDDVLLERIEQLCATANLTQPHETIESTNTRAFTAQLYGLERYSDLFTPRQLLLLLTCVHQLRQLHQQLLASGVEPELARAVATYLALLVDRLADWNSALCRWTPASESISDTFSRQALPIVWNFAEIYPFGASSGNLYDALERMVDTINLLSQTPTGAQVARAPAHKCALPDSSVDAVITDPPYYDNVSYADLSDFFYVWLKRTVGDLYPEHFGGYLTPKKWEAIADPARHSGDRAAATAFYTDIIQRSLDETHRILKPSAPLILIYAHKTTVGWSSVVEALRAAGFMVTEAWPISTEGRGRLRAHNSAALASSIFIVARKRTSNTSGNYTRDVQPELLAIVRERVRTLSEAGISGADLLVATVGAGLRAYTRFAHVERDNGELVDASSFLEEVQRAALAVILEHVVGLDETGVSAVDAASQYYVLAHYHYGTGLIDFDDANVLARGVGIELDGPGALMRGANPLVAKDKNSVQLRDYRQRGASRELGISSDRDAALIDVLQRLLWLNEHQPTQIKRFLDQAHADPARLRLVAEAVAGRGLAAEPSPGTTRDARTEEQKALGRLLAVWRRVVEEQISQSLL